jgi:hypothetical protein
VHALLVRESALNRYRVRPLELTRIRPRRLSATRTVVLLVGVVDVLVAVVFDAAGGGDAVAVPPPPQAATDRATSGITAALARNVVGLLRVIIAPSVGSVDTRSDRRWSNHATRSP